ncbi:hypothetical protein OG233_05775 [Streptomyces sp. NBC_01218]|uniref:DUF6059 family protein n=1 Tax=unclassified Streptomyces TaxID=2593676 RepID=UPI0023B98438|nr:MULTISPECIES: DUF6059 family protein [unclassified Streptomyces]WEH39065.1 hypothetical protein PZB77_05795 [Streptomyces sp. AM 2-1-1]WSQ50721.1 hypothetical protein OG233_05775 [Streptomyces sp. NBC_01218]
MARWRQDDGPGPVGRGVRAVYRALVTYGACWVPMPEDQVARIVRDAAGRPSPALTGPPSGHPERLCSEREFSELERRLMRELGVR